MASWLARVVQRREHSVQADGRLRRLLLALHVKVELVSEACALGPEFEEATNTLFVASALRAAPRTFARIAEWYVALLMSLRAFSLTRWPGRGQSARGVAVLLVFGLRSMVAHARKMVGDTWTLKCCTFIDESKTPELSPYAPCHLIGVRSLVSLPLDALLQRLLLDDRALHHSVLRELRGLFDAHYSVVAAFSVDDIFRPVAIACGFDRVSQFRDVCMGIMSAQRCYLARHVFAQFSSDNL